MAGEHPYHEKRACRECGKVYRPTEGTYGFRCPHCGAYPRVEPGEVEAVILKAQLKAATKVIDDANHILHAALGWAMIRRPGVVDLKGFARAAEVVARDFHETRTENVKLRAFILNDPEPHPTEGYESTQKDHDLHAEWVRRRDALLAKETL